MMKIMKKLGLILLSLIMLLMIAGCSTNEDNSVNETTEKLQVAVSIVPQETFVKAVAGDLVDVVTMIPPGSSPANYQPTPQQMIDLEESSLYFAIGVPTELANILPNMVANTDVKVVELYSIAGEMYEHRYFDEADTKRDPHIWLSPKRVIVMIETIRDQLSEIDPDNAVIYEANAAVYISELETVDQGISDMFAGVDNLEFIVMHPSFGYFADDYGLTMTSIEQDGKTATAAWMQEVIDFANEKDIHVIFYQQEFDSTQAETIAESIDGNVVEVAPLSPDYINNLKQLAEAFLESNE